MAVLVQDPKLHVASRNTGPEWPLAEHIIIRLISKPQYLRIRANMGIHTQHTMPQPKQLKFSAMLTSIFCRHTPARHNRLRA